MRKGNWIRLILGLFLLFATVSCGRSEQWLILYQAYDEDGQPADLVVVDMNGEEQRRIPMPDPLMMRLGVSTQAGYQVLVDTPEREFLVNAREGTLQELEFAGEVTPLTPHFRSSGGGKHWKLMGSSDGALTYLVNLETGKVHDLTALDETASPIFFGLFSPDEQHLVLGIGSELWLVPTADLSQARRLGTGETLLASSYSTDGEQIAYTQRIEPDTFEVVLEAVDGSSSQVVASGKVYGMGFVPGQNSLLLAREEAISLVSLKDLDEQKLLSLPASSFIVRHWFAPSTKKVLLIEDNRETKILHLVDLKNGNDQVLEDLEGFTPFFGKPDHRYVYLVDNLQFGKGGRRIASLDLETGSIYWVMDVDKEASYAGISDVTPDSKHLLISVLGDETMQLFLFEAEGGEPQLLAEADSVFGAFSPDGQWIAVSTLETAEGNFDPQIKIVKTDGSATRDLGEGLRPVWVRP